MGTVGLAAAYARHRQCSRNKVVSLSNQFNDTCIERFVCEGEDSYVGRGEFKGGM